MQENTEKSSDEYYQKFKIGLFKGEIIIDASSRLPMNRYFLQAAKRGDLEVIQYLIKNNYCDSNAEYSLNAAIENGHIDVFNYLIPYNTNKQIENALLLAAALGHFEITKNLLQFTSSNTALMPRVATMTSAASCAFQKKHFDTALLLSLLPEVKAHMHYFITAVTTDLVVATLSKEHKEITEFKNDCKMHLNGLNTYFHNACHFFNSPASKVFPIEIRQHVVNIGFAEIKQKWAISQTQLKNIYSIKEMVLADTDEPTPEENTLSIK